MLKGAYISIFILLVFVVIGCEKKMGPRPLTRDEVVQGWMILSDSWEDGQVVIEATPDYNINHLQISHHVIHDLRHVRDPERLELATKMTDLAHEVGIQEVAFWDRNLYPLEYYPEEFKTGPGGTIDLDNPAFWEWLKADYREMLELAPDIQALMLTFIETGARVEDQHSVTLKTNAKKLAAVVNAVSSVVIGEYGMNLYARTFAYTQEEFDNILGAIELFEYPEIRLMMKEMPHDFYLTHPPDFYAGEIPRSTIIEYDPVGEYHGQGVIANTWPEFILKRARDLQTRDHIIGYVARTDRYGDTRIVGRPSEINLYALKRYMEDSSVTSDQMYYEFITERYGRDAYPYVKAAFQNAFDIITASLYTLGTVTAHHSRLNYDPYNSIYARAVSGRWMDPPVVYVEHGVNEEFHYWKDIINQLAPAWAKAGGTQLDEIPEVTAQGWLEQGDLMNEEFLKKILTQKRYGVELAKKSLAYIEEARPYLTNVHYNDLHQYFYRTLLTARLHEAAHASYQGFRIYGKGESFRTPWVMETVREGLRNLKETIDEIDAYTGEHAVGQWDWSMDAVRDERGRYMAVRYYNWIVHEGWPDSTQGTHGRNVPAFPNHHGGMTFPLE